MANHNNYFFKNKEGKLEEFWLSNPHPVLISPPTAAPTASTTAFKNPLAPSGKKKTCGKGKEKVKDKKDDCSDGAEVLMSRGFHLTLLNMVFGLLPVTIVRCRIIHCKISLSKLYSMLLLATLLYVSYSFVIMSLAIIFEGTMGPTDIIATVILRSAHVLGYLAHSLRGHWIASSIPNLWYLSSRAMQESVVNIHGRNFKGLNCLSKFTKRCLLFYVLIIGYNELQVLTGNYEGLYVALQSFFNIQDQWQIYLFIAGFTMWDMTVLSHVLVSMFLSFFIISLHICLKSVNEELQLVVDMIKDQDKSESESGSKSKSKLEGIRLMKTRFLSNCKNWRNPVQSSMEKTPVEQTQAMNNNNHAEFGRPSVSTVEYSIPMNQFIINSQHAPTISTISDNDKYDNEKNKDIDLDLEDFVGQRLNYIKNCYVRIEDVTQALSSTYGISLFIEVIILMGTVLCNCYFLTSNLFVYFWNSVGWNNVSHGNRFDGNWGALGDIVVHFYFFYWLSVVTTKMVNESERPQRILKDLSYHKLSSEMQNKILAFKSDIETSKIKLTATDYFVINKALIASMCASILTFLIVLLQFKSEEIRMVGNRTIVPGNRTLDFSLF